MTQNSGSFSSNSHNPGPPVGIAFLICFVGDLAIAWFTIIVVLDSAHAVAAKLLMYTVPFFVNAPAIWWTLRTRREHWLKGLILSTALFALLEGTCFAVFR